MSTRKKFTLIELLVVIAIIAILAGMLLPALNSAKKKSQSVKCKGNSRQSGMSLLMYSNDFNSWLPPAAYAGNSWAYNMNQQGYAKGYAHLRCPVFPFADNNFNVFGLNIGPDSYNAYDATGSFYRITNRNNSKIFLLADTAAKIWGWPEFRQVHGAGNAAGGNYLVHFRHSQRANFCFLDGSVRDETPYSINKALSTNYLRTWRNEQLLGINGY